MDRLHRTRLLFGDSAIEKLRKSTVMVVGCGAVGSFAIEALARAGVGNFILIDSDKIEESNINRQLFALDSTIGLYKVDVAAARIFDINSSIKVVSLRMFFDKNTNVFFQPDFVIDAIDTVDSKIALYKWCLERDIKFVSSMGAARKKDPAQIKQAKLSKTTVCPLAAKIRKIVRDEHIPDFDVIYSVEKPDKNIEDGKTFGSLITVTGTFGLFMANYAINCILNYSTSCGNV